MAREVVAGNIPAHLDEVLVQSMIDSLASPLPATRMLQAQAMTRLWPKADGAVAESMGLACKDYMMEHTREYFALIPELIDQQASSSIWSDMIAQELMIDDENGPLEAADAFATALHAKAREQGASLDNEINRFHRWVRGRLMELTTGH
ncbi:MAG: hypothetical protein IPN85_18260 [Flavobacteriales bacterium]|nr:hypothetical protein [Flavobacteriales bacterium]